MLTHVFAENFNLRKRYEMLQEQCRIRKEREICLAAVSEKDT